MKLIRILARHSIVPLLACAALSHTPAALAAGPAQEADGVDVFADHCAVCHAVPSDEKIPPVDALMKMDANKIVSALTDGPMRLEGKKLTPAQRTAVAEFLSGGKVKETVVSTSDICKANPAITDPAGKPMWTGWGRTVENTRYQPDPGGLTVTNVPKLKLKWAFGIANTTQMRSQPAVFAGRLFFGSATGVIYSIDARTGCTYWTHKAPAGVRTAISIGKVKEKNGKSGYALYFTDGKAAAHALDAQTGKELWATTVDTHPAAVGTGSPTLYDGTLYVPVTGVSEESTSARPDYECCTFRGSVTALDAETGKVKWKHYTVPKPEPRGKSSTGKQLWGPAGVGIWSAPTVDPKRGLLYVGTGNAYAGPPVKTNDAVLALDLKTGKMKWSKQLLARDIWIFGCDPSTTGGDKNASENPNCPKDIGPDFDIAASPILTKTSQGRDVLIITQKSGMGFELDPEHDGKVIWQYHWGPGSPKGGVWGASTDGTNAYFGVAGQDQPNPGGLRAINLVSGQQAWFAPPQKTLCKRSPSCGPLQAAAITTIPGVVFSGSQDGGMRAYAARNGKLIWTFDTNQTFDTINGVTAHGGSIDGPGPVVAGGMLYVTSGNGGYFGRPGNVLLAFTVDGK